MADLGQFARNIRQRAVKVERNVNEAVRKVALVVDRELVLSTPVDTGRARSNWLVNVGSPNTDKIEPYVKGEGGSSAAANVQAALAQAESAVQKRKPEQDIYISNNLPYIGKLNEGSSAQAPAQFVETAVQAAVTAVNKTRVVT